MLILGNTKFMSTGKAYGAGIYLAKDSGTSTSYSKPNRGWQKSGVAGPQYRCMAICESSILFMVLILVVNANYTANPYYVIQNEDHIVTRFLLVWGQNKMPGHLLGTNVTMPDLHYFGLLND